MSVKQEESTKISDTFALIAAKLSKLHNKLYDAQLIAQDMPLNRLVCSNIEEFMLLQSIREEKARNLREMFRRKELTKLNLDLSDSCSVTGEKINKSLTNLEHLADYSEKARG